MADSADIPPPGSLPLRNALERFGDISLKIALEKAVEELKQARVSLPVTYEEGWIDKKIRPTVEITPRVRQLETAVSEDDRAYVRSLWKRLSKEEIVGFGRKNEPTASYQKIPPDSWQYLSPKDWGGSIVGELKKDGIKFYSVRICEAQPKVDWRAGVSLDQAAKVLCPAAMDAFNNAVGGFADDPGNQRGQRSAAWADIVKTLEAEIARYGLTLQFLDPSGALSGTWQDVSLDSMSHLGLSGIWINSFWACLGSQGKDGCPLRLILKSTPPNIVREASSGPRKPGPDSKVDEMLGAVIDLVDSEVLRQETPVKTAHAKVLEKLKVNPAKPKRGYNHRTFNDKVWKPYWEPPK